jgi:hypothetical protein
MAKSEKCGRGSTSHGLLLWSDQKRGMCSCPQSSLVCPIYLWGAEVDAWALKGIINNPTVTDKTVLR